MRKILALSIIVTIAAVAGVLLLSYRQHDIISIVFNSPSAVVVHTEIVTPLKHKPQGRPVIEGGIHNLHDLYNAMHNPDISENFSGFNFSSAHLIVLDHSVLAFVSFRVDGKGLFWTTSPVVMLRGETVWTDDNGNYLRSRCGNRISFAPGFRVLPQEEVPEMILEMPTVVPITPIAPFTPIHPRAPVVYSYTPLPIPFVPLPHTPISSAGGSSNLTVTIVIISLALIMRKLLRRML